MVLSWFQRRLPIFFSGLSEEFRRCNSVGSVQKKKRKIPLDFKNKVPTRRRSVSCRDYSQASGIDLDGLERASSEHDIRSQYQNFSWIVIAVFALLLLLLFFLLLPMPLLTSKASTIPGTEYYLSKKYSYFSVSALLRNVHHIYSSNPQPNPWPFQSTCLTWMESRFLGS